MNRFLSLEPQKFFTVNPTENILYLRIQPENNLWNLTCEVLPGRSISAGEAESGPKGKGLFADFPDQLVARRHE